MKNRLFIEAIAVVVACLLGFLPQYIKTRRLEGDLHSLQLASANAELRDLAGLAYVQASQKNYGLVAATCARFFNRALELASQTGDPTARKALEDLMPCATRSRRNWRKATPA